MRSRRCTRSALVLALVVLVSACGNKGDLVRPTPHPSAPAEQPVTEPPPAQ